MDITNTADTVPTSDRPDLNCLIEIHSTMLYRFCQKLTYSKEDAEDLFQETWFRVLRSPHKVQEADSPQSFLCANALSLWKSQQRKYARRRRIAPEQTLDFPIDSGQDVEESLMRRTEQEVLQALIDQLPEKFRIPLIMYYTLELGIAEIAKTLHLPSGTVKSRLFYARREIKKGWEKHESI